jgi:hypothetical protein
VGFEPTISAGERPQIYALDRAVTGTGSWNIKEINVLGWFFIYNLYYYNIIFFYVAAKVLLTFSDPTSDLGRQYDFPVLLRCRKTSETVFVAFVRPLSEPV